MLPVLVGAVMVDLLSLSHDGDELVGVGLVSVLRGGDAKGQYGGKYCDLQKGETESVTNIHLLE